MNDQAKSGHIVNVSSASAYLPSRALPAYATSKSAVLMLTECLRAELADQGIGVSAICPGIIDTPITGRARFVGVDDDEQTRRRDAAQRLYHKRGFTADRVARAIVDAVQSNRAEVPVSVEATGMRLIGRWAPRLARRLARLLAGGAAAGGSGGWEEVVGASGVMKIGTGTASDGALLLAAPGAPSEVNGLHGALRKRLRSGLRVEVAAAWGGPRADGWARSGRPARSAGSRGR